MKRHLRLPISFLLFSLLVTPYITVAQPICKLDHFSVYNGLAQRTVQDIAQDSKGFIWFSTWNGLNKFDGYTFKQYKAFPGDGCTLTSNRLSYITQTQTCDIWCQTYDLRAYLFDSQNEQFIDILRPFEIENQQIYSVRSIYALPKGISWIVCEQGAFRMEEQNCKEGKGITFYNPNHDILKGGEVATIYQDTDGDEWVLTSKGLSVIGKKQIQSSIPFKSINENNHQIYLISDNNQMAIYQPETQTLQFEDIPYSFSTINSIQNLGQDTIGLGTDNGLCLFFAKEKGYQLINPSTSGNPYPWVSSAFKDRYGELWLFSNLPGVTHYNLLTGEKWHHRTPKEDLPKAERSNRSLIFEDPQGVLWMIPQQGGLCYYDREQQLLKPYYRNYNDPSSKYSPVVLNYFLDKQGNFWSCNQWDITKISFFPESSQLQVIDSGFETRASFIDKENNLWVATKKGLIRVYYPDGNLKGYLTPEGNISSHTTFFSKNIYCFMEDDKGHIWMGSKSDGLFRLERAGNNNFHVHQFSHQENDPYSISHNSIYSIFQDHQRRIWVGCHGGGLNLMEETPQGKIRFLHSGNHLKKYPKDHSSKIRYITEVNRTLLIGTTEGLLTASCEFEDLEQLEFHRNIRIPDKASSLSSNDVTFIYTDSRKDTYVLTFTGGVNKILSKDLLNNQLEFKTYTTKDGLSSDLVQSIIEDAQGNLWVISENSLIRFYPEEESFESYDRKYFQQEFYFTEAAPIQNRHQQILLGTSTGLLKIHPEKLQKSTYTPPIVFTGFKTQGTLQNLHIDDLDELELKPTERNVTFQFAALDYVDSESIEYIYRMKGLEDDWNKAEKGRSATYINLPPGEYELQIRATNSDGVWMENARILPIIVLPTFWETYWAWGIYIIALLLFITAIVYIILYIYHLHHRINLEQQLTQIKLRFFTDISHELRTPLTLISSPVTEVLEHETLSSNARKQLTLVHKNTDRMLHLINQILDFRKIENKKMKVLLEKTDVILLLQKVMDSFRLIAEEKNIDFQLQTTQQSIYTWVDQDKIEKIIFNLLSNAFKYTPANKSITVNVSVEDDMLVILVMDKGIGIDPKKQQSLFQRFETLVKHNILRPSSGIGLSLVKELIELHSGSIEVKSQLEVGSQFTVRLPMDQSVYQKSKNTEFILNDKPSLNETIEPAESIISDVSPELITHQTEYVPDKKEAISVLIVEDNVELRTFLSDILSGNYQVIEAINGEKGLECAQKQIPDLIISDIMMPVMDGLDMVKRIKEDRNICHIPIILLSAKSSLDDRIQGLEQGIDDYITKPFSATYLKTRIKSLLYQRKQLQEIYLNQWLEKQKENPVPIIEIEPSLPKITPFDDQFIEQVMKIMDKHMDNSKLTIDEFAQELNMGRTVFYQKLKSIIGLSPSNFIHEMRIKRAKQLIESGEYNISSIAYMTGFNDPKYFSKCFKKKYGVSPSEYNTSQKD